MEDSIKIIIRILDEHNPMCSYQYVSGLINTCKIPWEYKSAIVQEILDELRK